MNALFLSFYKFERLSQRSVKMSHAVSVERPVKALHIFLEQGVSSPWVAYFLIVIILEF